MNHQERIKAIRERLDYQDFYEQHVDNLRGSEPQLVGNCPGHEDTAASFSVNVDTGQWTCHAHCGNGDEVQFCRTILQKSFGQSLTYLEDFTKGKAVIDRATAIPRQPKPEFVPDEAALEHAIKVLQSDAGKTWMDFLRKKNISEDITKQFFLGVDGKDGAIRLVIPLIDAVSKTIKAIHYRRDDPNGKKITTDGQSGDVLYGRLDPSHTTFICEGETDVLAMLSAGAKSVVGLIGAKTKWKPEWSSAIKSAKSIVICGDNDESGKEMNADIHAALTRDGIPAEQIRTIDLEKLGIVQEKGDIGDAIMSGKTVAEIESVAEVKQPTKAYASLLIDPFATPAVEAPWVVEGIFRKGENVGLAGLPSNGKSWWSLEIAVAVALGDKAFGRHAVSNPGGRPIIYWEADMAPNQIFPRVAKLLKGRDKTLEDIRDKFILANGNGNAIAPKCSGAELFAQMVRDYKPAVVIIDTFAGSVAGSALDANRQEDVRTFFSLVIPAIHEVGASLITLSHFTKLASGGKDKFDFDKVSSQELMGLWAGSGQFSAVYDRSYGFWKDPEQPSDFGIEVLFKVRSAKLRSGMPTRESYVLMDTGIDECRYLNPTLQSVDAERDKAIALKIVYDLGGSIELKTLTEMLEEKLQIKHTKAYELVQGLISDDGPLYLQSIRGIRNAKRVGLVKEDGLFEEDGKSE